MIGFINSNKIPNEDKVKRLQRLGFNKSQEVVDALQGVKRREMSKEIAERIKYYRRKYLLNKFITEDMVMELCGKYGLVLGEVNDFIGFVPKNKISYIEDFKVAKKDAAYIVASKSTYGSDRGRVIFDEGRFAKLHSSIYKEVRIRKPLEIAAPSKDFDLSKKEINRYRVVDKPVPDPVVLQPVNGGYLIVCAWGDEASDPIVVNEINN